MWHFFVSVARNPLRILESLSAVGLLTWKTLVFGRVFFSFRKLALIDFFTKKQALTWVNA